MACACFLAKNPAGELKRGDEGMLKWFKIDELPWDEMWQDDRFWLPILLNERKFRAKFVFDSNWKNILSFSIRYENP